jgi:hypothetical protein
MGAILILRASSRSPPPRAGLATVASRSYVGSGLLTASNVLFRGMQGTYVEMRRRGRPPTWTNEEREQVLALKDEGKSQRAIAEEVFSDASFRGRVERILREQALSP